MADAKSVSDINLCLCRFVALFTVFTDIYHFRQYRKMLSIFSKHWCNQARTGGAKFAIWWLWQSISKSEEITVIALFRAPEPKAQVHYCDQALSIVRLSVVNFSHFRLLLWNCWTEFNETWQKARSQRLLPSLCFSGWSEKQDGRPGLWLAEAFSTSPLKPLNRIQRNLTGSKISTTSTKFVFFGPIGKTRWPPLPLIPWDIFDFSS